MTFLPGILRPLSLLIYIVLLTLFLTALLFSAIWSRVHTSLWDYGTFGDGRYFVFQYLPTLIGMVLLLWLFEIEIAVYRIAPFIALASDSPASRSYGPLLPMYPSGFALPTLVHLKAGQPIIGGFLKISWFSLFTIPLLASSFNVYFRGSPGRWVWIATQGTIWAAIVLYIFLIGAIISLLIFLRRRKTGLKWDATSLADLIVLLERSNGLDVYAGYNLNGNPEELRARLAERGDSLGYWHTTSRPNEIFQTLGAPNQPTRHYSLEAGQLREKPVQSGHSTYPPFAPQDQRFSHGTQNSSTPVLSPSSASSPRPQLPWFLRPTYTTLWLLTSLLLCLAFLVISYLPSTAIRSGFLPSLPASVNAAGFSATNFLYSFLPALLGLLCLLLWTPFDHTLRRLQPYAALAGSGPSGALAERSLLLSYTADAPLAVTAKALSGKDWRVAATSFSTLIAATLPVLAGGVFWALFDVDEQRIRVYGHMPAFHALSVFVVLYALSYALLFSGRKRALPVHGTSLADVAGLVAQSRLLTDSAFRSPATKTALVTRLLSAPDAGRISLRDAGDKEEREQVGSKVSVKDGLRGFGQARQAAVQGMGVLEEGRYALGRYVGRDGREWVGVDRVNRVGGPEMVVGEF